MSITKILLAVLLCLAFSYNVQAVCCNSFNLHCLDGTRATPCCGYGPCNIFCCNCDYGCRQPNSSPQTKSYPKEAFGHYLDGKGISNSQIQDYLFEELDVNKDGEIDSNEISNGKNTPVEQIAAKLGRSDL